MAVPISTEIETFKTSKSNKLVEDKVLTIQHFRAGSEP